eukprot:CAMPEP_0115571948 /NCGR_PEP_ID=MMETSP0272-20121206/218_1 /TAXON_ID=71861 /ORGANISM="Scrippsiella trochoidea, Strain CCMP3099" /LENGTH=417 /DNA_ID=CAMNT_0003006541 /DNA_START=1 /DNA_END=1252 /DNA_ORIENTATION=-
MVALRILRNAASRVVFGTRHFQRDVSLLHPFRAASSLSVNPEGVDGRESKDVANAQAMQDLAYRVYELGNDRRWQEALQLFSTVSEPSHQLRFNMLRACTRSFKFKMAWDMFHNLHVREIQAYNLMICMLSKQARHMDQVRGLEQEMRSQSLQPNAITLQCLMASYSHGGDAEGAIRLISESERLGLSHTKGALSCAFAAYCKAGNHLKAREILSQMDNLGFSATSEDLTYLVSSYTKTQDEDGARAAFAELRRRGLQPTCLTYTRLVGCLSGPEALKKAEALLAEMTTEGIQPHLLFSSAAATMSADSADVLKILREMQARSLLRTAESLQDLSLDSIAAHKGALREACLSNDIRDLVQVLHQMRERGQPNLASQGVEGATALPAARLLPLGWQQALDPSSGRLYYWRDADPNGSV